MQFLPSLSSDLSVNPVSISGNSTSTDSNAFLESFNKELAENGVTPVVDASVEGGAPTGFRTLDRDKTAKLDSEDILYITAKLREKGIKESSLTTIEEMLAAGVNPTLGNLMGMVAKNSRSSETLTDQELAELGSALRKMGFSDGEIDGLEAMMHEGQSFQALQFINKRLGDLGKEGFTLLRGELNALMNGLDLSEDAKKQIAGLFGDGDSLELSGEALEKMLRPAFEELEAEKASQERMAAELRDVINDALEAKKIRETISPVADMRGSRQSDRAETRMRDDMTAKGNGWQKDGAEEDASLTEEQAGRDGLGARQRDASSSSLHQDGSSSLFARFDVSSGMTASVQAMRQNAATTAQRQAIFSQVEHGMLSQLKNGSHQMTLQLDPADLGRISLLLTVKGGEVRAIIRAENPETTAALTQQAEQLRASLEEQGLKVAQLDIETQLPQDTTRDQQWAASDFNQEREMREQARLSRLAKLRREAGKDLAQNMQTSSVSEEISAQGLHIIT